MDLLTALADQKECIPRQVVFDTVDALATKRVLANIFSPRITLFAVDPRTIPFDLRTAYTPFEKGDASELVIDVGRRLCIETDTDYCRAKDRDTLARVVREPSSRVRQIGRITAAAAFDSVLDYNALFDPHIITSGLEADYRICDEARVKTTAEMQTLRGVAATLTDAQTIEASRSWLKYLSGGAADSMADTRLQVSEDALPAWTNTRDLAYMEGLTKIGSDFSKADHLNMGIVQMLGIIDAVLVGRSTR